MHLKAAMEVPVLVFTELPGHHFIESGTNDEFRANLLSSGLNAIGGSRYRHVSIVHDSMLYEYVGDDFSEVETKVVSQLMIADNAARLTRTP